MAIFVWVCQTDGRKLMDWKQGKFLSQLLQHLQRSQHWRIPLASCNQLNLIQTLTIPSFHQHSKIVWHNSWTFSWHKLLSINLSTWWGFLFFFFPISVFWFLIFVSAFCFWSSRSFCLLVSKFSFISSFSHFFSFLFCSLFSKVFRL